jgi:hypothetical protein
VDSLYSKLGKDLAQTLTALKISFKIEILGKNLPLLTTARHGRFSAILIENYYKYINLAEWNRQLLDKYCREYGVVLLGFLASRPGDSFNRARVRGFSLHFRQRRTARALTIAGESPVPFIARAGAVLDIPSPDEADWILFEPGKGYRPVLLAQDGDDGQQLAAIIEVCLLSQATE